jgi:hypothetical protein
VVGGTGNEKATCEGKFWENGFVSMVVAGAAGDLPGGTSSGSNIRSRLTLIYQKVPVVAREESVNLLT